MTDSQDSLDRVYQVINAIPCGAVTTYGHIATLAGMPGAARRIGSILKQLPSGSKLPWHRVINAQGRISLPGQRGRTQRQRLKREGIIFTNDRINLSEQGWKP